MYLKPQPCDLHYIATTISSIARCVIAILIARANSNISLTNWSSEYHSLYCVIRELTAPLASSDISQLQQLATTWQQVFGCFDWFVMSIVLTEAILINSTISMRPSELTYLRIVKLGGYTCTIWLLLELCSLAGQQEQAPDRIVRGIGPFH